MRVKLSMICRTLNSFVMLIKRLVDAGLFDCLRSKFRSLVRTISFTRSANMSTCFSSPRRKLLRYPHSAIAGTENKTFSFWRCYFHPKAPKIRLIILKLLNNLVIEVRGDVNENTTLQRILSLRKSE